MLIRAMGGPDALQVDGIGGGHPLTSKVAVLNPSKEADIDVDYLFLQVDPEGQTISTTQNCGNILAGVGTYALHHGLVQALDPITPVRVRMLNSNAVCHLQMPTPGGHLTDQGETAIDGVPGTSAPIVCEYLDIEGSTCGSLLPTGNASDVIRDVQFTCIDNGMPVVVMAAKDFGLTGYESPEALDGNEELKNRLEAVRLELGPRMNLGDVRKKSVPKMCLVSPARDGGLINTRTFIPHVCHRTIGVLGAVSVATACLLPGTPAAALANMPDGNPKIVDVEHPGGAFPVQLETDHTGHITRAGVIRTARLIFTGEIYIQDIL